MACGDFAPYGPQLGENRNVGNLTLAELNVGSPVYMASGNLPPVVALFQPHREYVIVMYDMCSLN